MHAAVALVREQLRSFGVHSANPAGVELLPYVELQSRHSGCCGYTVIGLGITRYVRSIVIADGLPMTQFGQVLSHEIGHAWLAGCPGSRSSSDEEGICELVSVWWLRRRTGPLADHLIRTIETNTSPVYGGGYRRIAALARGMTPLPVAMAIKGGHWDM